MGQTTAQRIKDRHFADEKLFDPKKGSYSALPFILRKLQFLFEPRVWQIYTYILMKTGPEGVAWFDLKEMSFDLQFKSIPKLKPYVTELAKEGWICCAQSGGKDYYVVIDPVVVLHKIWNDLTKRTKHPQTRWDSINDLLEMLNLPMLVEPTE